MTKTHKSYYNEIDSYAAEWLRNLIAENLIAPGDVDERSIADVQADDLIGYTQCHFFAGIGGWSYALRLAGWPDDRPVWTGSCPCQPFSCAGKGLGEADRRHLWPEFRRLVEAGKPSVVFGEQVASKAGREWFAGVRSDLETLGYETGCADLCAASAGAPHIRQRLFWGGVTHSYAERNLVQGWKENAKNCKREASSMEQLPRLLQHHSWPTLSDSKFWSVRYGIPTDVGVAKANRAIGNAIVPEIAKVFIECFLEAQSNE